MDRGDLTITENKMRNRIKDLEKENYVLKQYLLQGMAVNTAFLQGRGSTYLADMHAQSVAPHVQNVDPLPETLAINMLTWR